MTSEIGLPWIPYVSIAMLIFSITGAIGLIKYRLWGFYCIYIGYLLGTLVAWLPLAPTFLFGIISSRYRGEVTIMTIYAMLLCIIYLHVSARKQGIFSKTQII
jgi:hypothetical protein